MRIVATVLFALAGIVGVTLALTLLPSWYRFPDWLDDVPKYETLLGAFMFAGSVALLGAVLTSWNQWILSNREVAAERLRQELAIRPRRRQIASEVIGETDVIVLHHESVRSAIENALRVVETRTGKVASEGVPVRQHVGRHFDHSPAEFRLLPGNISKELRRFYSIVRETESDLEWYSRASEAYANQGIRLMSPGQMVRLLRKILGNIDSSSRLKRTVVDGLKEIRDTDGGGSDRH